MSRLTKLWITAVLWVAFGVLIAWISISHAHRLDALTFELEPIYAEPPRDVLLYSGVIYGGPERYCWATRIRATGPVAVATFECRFPATPLTRIKTRRRID